MLTRFLGWNAIVKIEEAGAVLRAGVLIGAASDAQDGSGRERRLSRPTPLLKLCFFCANFLTLASKASCDRLNPEVRANITARCVFCSPDTEAEAVFWGRCRTNLAQIGAVFSHW